MNNITILEKDKCCGCAACANICPTKAISMIENEEIYLKQFLPYKINSDIHWLKSFSRSNRKIKTMFFNKVKESFKSIEQEFSSEILCRSYRYGDFLIILKSNSYEEYRLRKLVYKILGFKKER